MEAETFRNPGETKTFYPHQGIALLQIGKVWGFLACAIAGIWWASENLHQPDIVGPARLVCLGLVGGGVLFAAHRMLHYANTYVQISDDAIIYRAGWVPSTTDTIFWVNIKDINTSTSVGESLLGSGTIILMIAIRAEVSWVKIPYMPQPEALARHIREHLGTLALGTRQVTYT